MRTPRAGTPGYISRCRTPRRPRGARALAVAAASALGIACAGPPPVAQLTFLARDPGVVRPRILQGSVEGEACFTENAVAVSLRPPWRGRLADHGRAITDALSKAPGANVLTDVRISVRVEQYLVFQRVCAIVRGNAGLLE